MRKKLFMLFFMALFGVILSVTASANPDGPKFISPGQYSEHKISANVVIKWNKPDAKYGTVSYYKISARLFALSDDVTNANLGTVILNQNCSTTSYTLSGSLLERYSGSAANENRKYRIAVCAVMKDGTKRWSDAQYFYIASHNTPISTPISFRIYNGFVEGSKEQVYYSCQNWNNKLNLGREIVNTYPYSQGTNDTMPNDSDGINIVTKNVLDENVLMQTNIIRSLSSSSKYKLVQADIVVNSTQSWRNTNVSGTFNFYDSMIHEMGHVIGLSDKSDSWATEWTMYQFGLKASNKRTSLEAQDISNAKSLYN